MKKPIIISDKNKKSLLIKKIISNILKSNLIDKPNLVLVIGGDGFMLKTLKKKKNPKSLFFGINS